MAYTKTNWVTGDVISSTRLNHAEQGIYDNSVEITELKNETTQIYNTVAAMTADVNSLSIGMTARTLGYYAVNDGGGALYIILGTQSTTMDISLGQEMYASVIDGEEMNVLQYGLQGNNTLVGASNNTILSNLITFAKANNKHIYIPSDRTYTFSNHIITDDSYLHYDGVNEKLIISKAIDKQFRKTRWWTKDFSEILGATDSGIYSLQGCTFIKSTNTYVFCFYNTQNEDEGMIVVANESLDTFQRKTLAFGHANGITYNPKTGNLYIACGATGTNANKVMAVRLSTLDIAWTSDFGLSNIPKSGIAYDEIHDIYYVLASTIYVINNSFEILAEVGTYNEMSAYINPNTVYHPQTVGCIDGTLYFTSSMLNNDENEYKATSINTFNYETSELKQFWTYQPESFAEEFESIADRNENYFIGFGGENATNMSDPRRIIISIFSKLDSTNDAASPNIYPEKGKPYALNNVSYTNLSATKQSNICMLNMTGRVTEEIAQYGGVAMLPVHFRPTEQIYFGDNQNIRYAIKTDGTVQVLSRSLSTGFAFSATVVFVTAT